MEWNEFWRWVFHHSDIVRDLGTVSLGIIGGLLLLWRSISAGRQAEAAQAQAQVAQDQIVLVQQDSLHDRYQKGADMLNGAIISTRLGGIYSLRRLAEDYPDQFHLQVMEILCAFIRKPPSDQKPERELREDVQAALDTIIHRRDKGIEIENATGGESGQGRTFRVNLAGADLEWAIFYGAKLQDAVLDKVRMMHARGNCAVLSRASMIGTNLHRVTCIGAKFDRANMNSSDMSHAVFQNASFKDARLGTNMAASHFEGADMSLAHILPADLTKARLDKTDLSGARFSKGTRVTSNSRTGESTSRTVYCQVTQAQLDMAIAHSDDPPAIPEGTIDIETCKSIVWNHQHCSKQWVEYQKLL